MLPYRILDTAHIQAPPEVLFAALTDFARFPEWFPKHYHVEVFKALETIEGREVFFYPNRLLTIGWKLQSSEAPHSFRLNYSRGWHTGHGLWKFEPENGGTRISYFIDILAKTRLIDTVYGFINFQKRHSQDINLIFDLLAKRVGAPLPTDRTNKSMR